MLPTLYDTIARLLGRYPIQCTYCKKMSYVKFDEPPITSPTEYFCSVQCVINHNYIMNSPTN